MSPHSSLLFARPSAAEGFARVFDFANSLSEYNLYFDGVEDDAIALASDWLAVGMDIRTALEDYAGKPPTTAAEDRARARLR